MTWDRVHLDSRAEHNLLMARLCQQAAAGLAEQIALTRDPKKREAIRSRIHDRELQCEMHRKIVEDLQAAG
jgi:hypothetical protein